MEPIFRMGKHVPQINLIAAEMKHRNDLVARANIKYYKLIRLKPGLHWAICDIVQRRLSARMMCRMQLFQPLPRHMRINLRSRNICMAQQHLHHAQIRAVIEQVGSEGVAQGVW